MKSIVTHINKLRTRSLDELRVRASQAIAIERERRGLSAQMRVPSGAAFARLLTDDARSGGDSKQGMTLEDSLLNRFRDTDGKSFFASLRAGETTVAAWRRNFGEQEAGVISNAEKIVNHRFDLLGLRDLDFGNPIEWNYEPVAGKRTAHTHWSQVNYLDPQVAGDKKIIWELNRHGYFATLGKAYLLTGNERYANVFASHLASWMDDNPPNTGINWASNLELAFRAIAWLWAFEFFRESPALTPALYTRALKFLYLHACHLETYLSTYFSPNTHLTGEALGLFYLGTQLKDFRASSRWRAVGESILLEQLDKHVRPDGVYFEQTSYYHRYTIDFYTHYLLIKQACDEPVEPRVRGKLTALLDHLMHITRPDGTTPFFGDDDGGRLVWLDGLACNDFRSTLAIGAALLERPDYKYVAAEMNDDARPSEGVLWLLGAGGLEAFDKLKACPPDTMSRSFEDGGYYVMRDSWNADANFMLIDCGTHGAHNCGHAHADALAFELAARGRTMLVDAGTYTYTLSPELRDEFRSSSAHNTLTLDGEPSSVPASAFQWHSIAHCQTLNWTTRPRFDFFEGTHDGYKRLPATHTRAVLFLKNDYWIMRDRINSEAAHRYDVHLHFAPDAAPAVETHDGMANRVREMRSEHQTPGLGAWMFESANGITSGGTWTADDAWISSCYGAREKASVMRAGGTTAGHDKATDIITILIPHAASHATAVVRQVAARGGCAFEIDTGDARDALLIRAAVGTNAGIAHVEAANIASDFAWTWIRTDATAVNAGTRDTGDAGEFSSREFETPRSLVLINGNRLTINNRQLFHSETLTNRFAAERRGDTLFIDTDARGEWRIAPCGARRIVVNDVTTMPVETEREELCVG